MENTVKWYVFDKENILLSDNIRRSTMYLTNSQSRKKQKKEILIWYLKDLLITSSINLGFIVFISVLIILYLRAITN